MNKFKCKLKSRKQMEKDIPRERWGWWIDVCPNQVLVLRRATPSDLRRCSLANDDNRNPGDFFCELGEHGSLVSKEAVDYVMMSPGSI